MRFLVERPGDTRFTTRFGSKEARRNRVKVTYHVLDEEQSICGSINVKLEDSAALLKHWSNASASAQNKHLSAQQSPVSALAKAFLRNRTPFSKTALLRGSNG